jgi:hypothetical protein
MGDAASGPVGPVRLAFNPQLRVEFHGATVTSDAGLLLPTRVGRATWPERHARYFVLQLAESYLTSTLFRQILGRIERLGWHPS